jgi:hypothetical protein
MMNAWKPSFKNHFKGSFEARVRWGVQRTAEASSPGSEAGFGSTAVRPAKAALRGAGGAGAAGGRAAGGAACLQMCVMWSEQLEIAA